MISDNTKRQHVSDDTIASAAIALLDHAPINPPVCSWTLECQQRLQLLMNTIDAIGITELDCTESSEQHPFLTTDQLEQLRVKAQDCDMQINAARTYRYVSLDTGPQLISDKSVGHSQDVTNWFSSGSLCRRQCDAQPREHSFIALEQKKPVLVHVSDDDAMTSIGDEFCEVTTEIDRCAEYFGFRRQWLELPLLSPQNRVIGKLSCDFADDSIRPTPTSIRRLAALVATACNW